jgi:hypothetical protein
VHRGLGYSCTLSLDQPRAALLPARPPQATIKRELLAAMGAEADRGAAKQLAAAVERLGDKLLAEAEAAAAGAGRRRSNRRGAASRQQAPGGWPELLAGLQAWLQPGSAASAVTREAALKVRSAQPSPTAALLGLPRLVARR